MIMRTWKQTLSWQFSAPKQRLRGDLGQVGGRAEWKGIGGKAGRKEGGRQVCGMFGDQPVVVAPNVREGGMHQA